MFKKRNNQSKILAIGAHPDDIELSCGGYLHLLKAYGEKIYKVICTNGEIKGDPMIRKKEQIKADIFLGVEKTYFLNLKDGNLTVNSDFVKKIEKIILEITPDIILVHTTNDHHQDHQNTSKATKIALRYSNITLIEYPSLNSRENFEANLYVDISLYLKEKNKDISFFQSQKHNWYLNNESLLARAMNAGLNCNAKYAESFYIRYSFLS